MNYSERLENVAVLGAAGKMGSGIVLLTAMEMTDLSLLPENKSKTFTLNAVDVSREALSGLIGYLRGQVKRAAEKKTVALRKVYAHREDLVENEQIINQYVDDVLAVVRPTTRIEATADANLVFEAVNENIDLKLMLYDKVRQVNNSEPWFFTNTSSIPISELDARAGLNGRIIGFHFYNPPAVQKLVEVIEGKTTLKQLSEFASEYAKKMRKTVVPSNDIAGFIGNGHFMRDMLHGISEVERLVGEFSFVEAVYMINRVSQEYLVRPMGIFQLTDYVGLDVCQGILKVMDERIVGEALHSPLIDRLVAMGVKGGQFSNGAQKDGFLQYSKGRPTGIFDPETKAYVPISSIQETCDAKLGTLQQTPPAWKKMLTMRDRSPELDKHFAVIRSSDTLGAELARRYGKRSCEIGLKLVSDGVAANADDVNKVLLTGFYHVYGPINNYFN